MGTLTAALLKLSVQLSLVSCFSSGSGWNEFHPDPACKLSANLYDIYHCCVYSEKLLVMDGGTVRDTKSFIPRINLRK
jgi:hypothetical protein